MAAVTALKGNINLANLDTTDHHIYPGNRILAMMRAGLADQTQAFDIDNQPTTRGLRIINDYLGSRLGIQQLLRSQINEGDP